MDDRADEIERLISRCLDKEATAEERRRLRQLVKADPRVRELMRKTAAIDRAVGRAVCRALQPQLQPAAAKLRIRLPQLGAFAVAAGLLLALWLVQEEPRGGARLAGPAQARASWFAPPIAPADRIAPVDPADERPQVQVRDTQRDWIIVPGREPGEYLLIAIDRVRTRAVRIERDF
jgi:hypothetical protein